MGKLIYSFTTRENPELFKVGGKAKALIETSQAGFKVPQGFVLSLDFFETWLEKIKSSNNWSVLLKNLTKENCDKVQKEALALSFDKKQREILEKSLETYKQSELFAVRSSSPEEDLEETSFAGMYETYLKIEKDDLEKYIKQAFASAFSYRVMEYKKQNNINIENTSIAIIVQRQIASDISGVGFSINPNNNSYDEIMINASFGLGEDLVAGLITPDTYIVNSLKNKISKKEIASNRKSLAVLKDRQILEVAKLVKKCQDFYGKPVDIEWTFANNKLYLLQTRPITGYLPLFKELLTGPGEKKKIYIDTMGLTQGFYESMSPLGMEVFEKAFHEIKGDIMPTSLDGAMPVVHGRFYINVSNLPFAMGRLGTKKFIENYDENLKKIFKDIDFENEYRAEKMPEVMKATKSQMVKMALKTVPSLIKAQLASYKDLLKAYNKTADQILYNTSLLDSKDDFPASVDLAFKDLGLIMDDSSGVIMAGMASYASIKRMFKGLDVESLITSLAMNLEGNPTSEMGYLLYKLASYPEFQETKSEADFTSKIENNLYTKDFMEDYRYFLDKHGARGFMEIDIASKRVYEDPALLYEKLININIQDSQIYDVKEKRKRAYNILLGGAKLGGFQRNFEKQAEIYQASFGYREHPKYVIVVIIAKLRDLALELGKSFVEQGRLDDENHIFDLYLDDIKRGQKDIKADLRKSRERNLEPYKKLAHVKDWPLVIDSRGKIFKAAITKKDGDLLGTPIAPGLVRGRAKILRSPYEKPLNPGEILITKATEPSWTPIFINAAGVIMEVGGPLQHGGIIAREYGIPCVSGLLGIMDLVEDGDLLEVDGSNGIVRILAKPSK